MSDLSIYELEDIWDDFEHAGDHIVPEPANNQDNEDKSENDSCKKPRLEVTPVQNNEEKDSKTLNNEMEKESWFHIPDGVYTASGDAESAKVIPADEGINDVNLFPNDGNGDGKESNDLLYYGWPDIGNFEDVDRMLSNCDSSFGLGVTGNDDELVWFTSEDPAGGYEEAMKMDLKFPCSEQSDLTKENDESQGSNNKRSTLVSQTENEFNLKNQVSQQNETKGNYGLKSNNIQISSSNESRQGLTSIYNQQQNKILQHDYMQNNLYLHHNYVPTGIKFENTAQKENFNASMKKSGDVLFSGNQEQMLQKQFHMFESQSDMKLVNKGVLTETDVLEGSSISSELDEISLEATSFRQLLQVMEQLDLSTKLCIRDSLYRLARSAEQRHNYAGISDSTATGGPLMPQGTNNKYSGLIDMETDTNPIDRTIAHLLFHRPSESSTPTPLKPNVPGPTTVTPSPMVVDKLSCEQVESESDDKISSTGKN